MCADDKWTATGMPRVAMVHAEACSHQVYEPMLHLLLQGPYLALNLTLDPVVIAAMLAELRAHVRMPPRLSYQGRRYRVMANVKNVFGKDYYAGVLSANMIAVGDPRTIMVKTVFDF